MKLKLNNLEVSIYKDQNIEILNSIEKLGIPKENLGKIEYIKRSIDSRKRTNIKYIYNLELSLNKDSQYNGKVFSLIENKKELVMKRKKSNGNIAIIGTGPAGLFAALRLAEYGYKPIIFERGETVSKRYQSVKKFEKDSILNENSNIQFGEGGAGTFSDGKLNTGVKSPYLKKIFKTFVDCGAHPEIMYDFKPHIGTDTLMTVVKNLREKIITLGGTFYFDSKLTDIKIEKSTVKSIEINNSEIIPVEKLILATGHSARDIYKLLANKGVNLENKHFAIGLRIEHPRTLIDKMQYGEDKNSNILGSAPYKFTYNDKKTGTGVYSFCMCPGGYIVNAASEKKSSLVNGMSYSKRDGPFSNSAIVVSLSPKEYGTSLFDGVKYQESLEKKMYNICEGYGAIYQNLYDFMDNKKTCSDIKTSYKMELKTYNYNDFFPKHISHNLQNAFQFWKKNKLFISNSANLIGTETRTSAPIRIKRSRSGVSENISNLYPIGEGAGYAGGIISAAIDGIKTVDINFTEE